MAFVALLRGVNVGGKAAVDMRRLKATFERIGLTDARTFINSGNVVFTSTGADRSRLRRRIEQAIAADFDLPVPVLLRDTAEMQAVVEALPEGWRNDGEHKCDVFFCDDFASPDCIDLLPFTPGLEEARFVPGAVLCRIPKARLARSKVNRIVGTDLYKRMTIRNCNTTRKVYELLVAADG